MAEGSRAKIGCVGCLGTLGLGGLTTLGLTILACIVGVGFAWMQYDEHVLRNPGEHLERDAILRNIAQESTVYYADGRTRLGVFFEDQHRVFVQADALPPAFAFAIVASEDGQFWSHPGVDLFGIARAMGQNIAAGRVVAGGSTLSQQTAKNVFHRPDRSLKSKLTEMVNTLRLEAHYDKREILTFYANQFHVAGNGRGLAIAGRYFFDVDGVAQLSVLQNAYIAGLVKGPSNYDPFLGNAERRERATVRAHERTRYVLRRIVTEDPENLVGPYTMEELEAVRGEAQRLLDEGFELPFKRGSFRYDTNVVVDELRRRLTAPPLAAILADAGIDHPETAGLDVITTLDEVAQRAAVYGLRHHLTEVGVAMEGLGAERFVLTSRVSPTHDPSRVLVPHTFFVARVVEHLEGLQVLLDLGGQRCLLDPLSVTRAATAVARGAKKNKYAKASSGDRQRLVDTLKVDAKVLVSIRELPEGQDPRCDLELATALQGAATVVQDGKLRAMVGGNDNRNFNRARAPRQMGSTWKPLVFHAALSLGWRPEDRLDNWQNAFHYGTVFYYPSADHVPEPEVTMAMAGVNSENVASVWLLYHLLDRLDPAEILQIADEVGLLKAESESEEAWHARLQKAGLNIPAERARAEAAFFRARKAVLDKIALGANPDDELALLSLLYGHGFSAERERVSTEPPDDRDWKYRVLDHSWTAKREKMARCLDQYRILESAIPKREVSGTDAIPDLTVRVDGDVVSVACGTEPPEGYESPHLDHLEPLFPDEPEPEPETAPAPAPEPIAAPPPTAEPKKRRKRKTEDPEPRPRRPAPEDPHVGEQWSTDIPTWGVGKRLAPDHDMLVDGRIHISTLRAVKAAIEPVEAGSFDPEVLPWLQDFRVMVAIEYVVQLAQDYGIHSDIKKILPMPLGASEVTIEEQTALYSGLVTGLSWAFPGTDANGEPVLPAADPTLLIQEIRSADGTVLYRAQPHQTRVEDARTGAMTADILRSVVVAGTGRRAKRSTRAGRADVPLGGKTGTTNDFRNAAFLGYAPCADGEEFTLDAAWAIGVYVGYDDNRSMRHGNIVLAGASGALPTWTLIARGLGEGGRLGTVKTPPSEDRIPPLEGLERREAEGIDVLTWVDQPPPRVAPDALTAPPPESDVASGDVP